MGKLQAALAWAQRGFRVFPLEATSKEPAISGFGDAASSDPGVVSAWWRDPVTGAEKDYNVGVLTTGMVVVDIDVKDGKPGLQNFLEMGGSFDTLVVETPSGGYHCYYSAEDSANTYPAEGVDIRSHNGYVLAPGSFVPGYCGGAEYKIAIDKPLAVLPDTIASKLHRPGVNAREVDASELDVPASIKMAENWIALNAPIAIEGQQGDATTYTVACKLVRDFSLTEETAFEILIRGWNDRCLPPWDPDELWGKVQNAANYGVGSVGGALPQVQFGGVTVLDPPPVPTAQSFRAPDVAFGNALEPFAIPPRPWLVNRLLMRGAVTVITAAGATGKTTLALQIAAHGAAGRDFAGYSFKTSFKTVMYSAEEDRAELSRRLFAVANGYGLDWPTVKAGVMLIGSDDVPLTIASQVQRQPKTEADQVEWLLGLAREPGVGLLVLDPLVEIHTCDENDTVQMRFVMSVLRSISQRDNIAVLAPHHTSKSGGAQQNRAGNVDISRGAGSITNSARIALTLVAATDQDREQFNIPETEKGRYVRMDDAKMNLALATNKSVWFRKETIRTPSGDDVGILKTADIREVKDGMGTMLAARIAAHLTDLGLGAVTPGEAAVVVRSVDSLFAKMSDTQIRQKMEAYFMYGVKTEGGTIKWIRDEHNKAFITIT